MELHISEILLTFETLEKAMNLPPGVKVVAVKEQEHKGVLKFRIVSATPPPEEYNFDHLSMAGDAYRHPEKYKAGPKFGETVGGGDPADPGPEPAADVSVTR